MGVRGVVAPLVLVVVAIGIRLQFGGEGDRAAHKDGARPVDQHIIVVAGSLKGFQGIKTAIAGELREFREFSIRCAYLLSAPAAGAGSSL